MSITKHLYTVKKHGRVGLTLLKKHKRLVIKWGAIGAVALLMLVQILYPTGRMPLYATVDGLNVSGWKKQDAAWELDKRYAEETVAVYFGEQDKPQLMPTFQSFGLSATNDARLDDVRYSWWKRLIPTSLFWAGKTIKPGEPSIARDQAKLEMYLNETVGEKCLAEPTNATLQYKDGSLQVVPAKNGGRCNTEDVKTALANVSPRIGENRIDIHTEVLPPDVTDNQAKELGDTLTERVGDGVPLQVGDETVLVPKDNVLSWLDFGVVEGELQPVINDVRAVEYLGSAIAPKVATRAGVSKITTRDFVVVSEEKGADGRALNNTATLNTIMNYMLSVADVATAVTITVPPEVEYTRTYSSTDVGLSALIKQYADDNKGVYGVSLVELSGERRRAGVNDARQFTTASTYKLFVAYSTLKRVEQGTYNWGDPISGGRDLAACFDAMIVQSDNACAEALLAKIGFRAITQEMNSLGLKDTTFLKGDYPLTTAADLSTFLATLESGQMLTSESRARLLDAMKRNVHRQGIPAGTSAVVADKVGFLDNLLHDAGVVYSPQGTYVLVVLTEDSSWGAIADLTRKIEELRG